MKVAWVITKSSRQIVSMPLQMALRIARKRGFEISTIKPRLTLWEKITKRPKFVNGIEAEYEGLESIVEMMPLLTMTAMVSSALTNAFGRFNKMENRN